MQSSDMQENDKHYNEQQRSLLLDLARRSVETAVTTQQRIAINPADYDQALQQPRATFVTLKMVERLRGCIGSLEPVQSLVESVVDNARSAALSDPRFNPVIASELESLSYDISVLSPTETLSVINEEDLLLQLRPFVDGLILAEGWSHRSTYLPSVWEQLPDPKEFVGQLKLKAGLPGDYWSGSLHIARYTTESWGTH